MIYNSVWRPLHHPVEDNPLALCDGSTITEEDLVEVDHITRSYHGRTMYGLYKPEHKWYYLSNQTPEEVVFIKCFDSEVDRARLTPHSAFLDSTSPKDAPHRESIEVRVLVFDAE